MPSKSLDKLKKEDFLTIEPTSHYSIITVLISDSYSGCSKKSTSQNTRQVPTKYQASTTEKKDKKEKKGKNTPDKSSDNSTDRSFQELCGRYDPALLQQVFKAIASTRKTGKVSENVLKAQLLKWDSTPVDQVEAGLKKYMQRNYAAEGKDEKYLWGIIRNMKEPTIHSQINSTVSPKNTTPVYL